MAIGSMLTTILEVESHRAYPNLYELTITDAPGAIKNRFETTTFSIKNRVSKVDFEDSFGLNLEQNEAIQAFIIKGINRIKGINLTIKESSGYEVISVFKDWMNAIYDFNMHVFNAIDPTGTIELNLDDGNTSSSIVCKDVIPKSLSYPSYSWSEANPIEVTVSFSVGQIIWNDIAPTSPVVVPTTRTPVNSVRWSIKGFREN